METGEKTNMSLSCCGLPPCPRRPAAPGDSDEGSRFPVSTAVPCGDEDSSSFEFWARPFSLTDQNQIIDCENLNDSKMDYTGNYENTTHSRSSSNEGVDDCGGGGDGRSWKVQQCPSEIDIQFQLARKIHPDMDLRKLRRIVTNRISAQRSRLRKIKYVSDLEHKRVSLQGTISHLSSEIVSESNKKQELLDEKTTLNQKISFLADDRILKNAQKKMLRKEADRLIQVLLKQKQEQEMMTSMMMTRMTPTERNQLASDLNFHYLLAPSSLGEDENGEEKSGDTNMVSEVQSWIGSENGYDELQQIVNQKILEPDPTENYCGKEILSRNYDFEGVIKCESGNDFLETN